MAASNTLRGSPASRSSMLLAALLLITPLAPRTASAQSATGALTVSVDDAGAAGTTVRVDCPGVSRTVLADDRARAHFPHLPSDRCRITAAVAAADVSAEADVVPGTLSLVTLAIPPGDNRPTRTRRPLSFDTSHAFAHADLRATPRPADPWSVLRDVPGVIVDRVNVGGSDTAQQAIVVSRGDPGTGAVWTIDGVTVTDPAALGSTSVFPDMDALERIDVRTNALDVRVRTPGAQVGLRLREPGDQFAGAVHLRGSDDALQWDNRPATLEGRPFFRNRTRSLLDVGAEAGGAAKKDRLWLFGGWARSALRQDTLTEHGESLRTSSFTGKARLRLGRGSLSLFAIRSEKVHEERDSGLSSAPAARWRQSGPAYVLAVEDRRDVGSASGAASGAVSLLSRVSWLDAGFRLDPQGGTAADPFEDYRGVFQGSYYTLETSRRRLSVGVEAAGRRRWLGLDHQVLAGAGYDRMLVGTDVAWPGNKVIGLERQSVFFRTFRLTGFALPTRDQSSRSVHDAGSLYFQDTVFLRRLAFTGGARIERMSGHNQPSAVGPNPVFPGLLPAVDYPGAPSAFRWLDVLPRVGVSWDLLGNGALVGRASYAAYAAALGTGDVTFDNPIGREYASLTYYWNDRNGDRHVDEDELDLLRGRLGESGVLPEDPSSTRSPHVVDSALRSPRTHQLLGSVDVSLGHGWTTRTAFSYRRNLDVLWRPLRDLALADYKVRGAVGGTLLGHDYSVGYYAPASQSRIIPGNGRRLANREGYHQDVFTTEASVRGSIRTRVRLEAWFAFTDWREYFDDRDRAIQDPTSTEGEPLLAGGTVTVRPGGFARGDVFVNARWTTGGTVHGALPYRLAASARVYARDGFPIPYFQVGNTGDPTGAAKNVLVSPQVDTYRLPALVLVDARLERPFALGRGTLVAGVDVFNVFNRDSTLQVARDVELPAFNRPREIVRPRIFRLGVAYSF